MSDTLDGSFYSPFQSFVFTLSMEFIKGGAWGDKKDREEKREWQRTREQESKRRGQERERADRESKKHVITKYWDF